MTPSRWLSLGVLLVFCTGVQARQADPPGPLNATCPVMPGEPVDPDMFTDYEGKRIWFCCTKCKTKFARNPSAYLANLPQFGGVEAAAAPEDADIPDEGTEPSPGDPASPQPPGPEVSAPSPGAAPGARVPPAAADPQQVSDPTQRVVEFLGRLHPIAVHFPIALLLTAALFELISLVSRSPRPRHVARTCLVLGALGAAVAAVFGWISADFEPFSGELADTLFLHRWLGIAVAAASVLCIALMLFGDRTRALYRVTLFLSAALVGITSYFGGDLVRGPNHLFAGLWPDSSGDMVPRPAAAQPSSPQPAVPAAQNSTQDSGPRTLDAFPHRSSLIAQHSLDRLLFASNNEEAFVARRDIRLARVEAPTVQPAGDHPIDHFIHDKWREAGLPEAANPPARCDDAAFLRRAYLDVIGVIPTIEECHRFLSGTEPDRRERLIDELLARDDDYAAHWTPFWEDALGSANTELQGGIPTRGNYRTWIYDSFKDNTPFDVLAAELIDPSMPGHKAAIGAEANGKVSKVAYVKSETHVDAMQSAANVAQVFLGTSMKCASCHSHFENDEWPQQRFLAFAGMFAGRDLEVIRCEARTGQIVAAAFPFELPGMPSDVPQGEDGRLRRAAQLLTDPLNPRFARSIVNRLWKRYLGLGLFEPVDDFRQDRAPSHPELLDWLAYDFMTHGYDLKHTIRLILTSRTYQTRYDAALADSFDVSRPGEPRYFRSPTLRRLTAEQAIDSVRVATAQRLDPSRRLYLDTASTALTRTLGRPASRNEISTGRPDDVAIVQALELLNGDEYHSIVYSGALFQGLADPAPGTSEAGGFEPAVEILYRAVLSRPPTPNERGLAVEYVASALDRDPPLPSPNEPTEIVFIDDELPEGVYISLPDGWPWTTDRAFRGVRSHRLAGDGAQVQHHITGAREPFPVGPADTLFVHVYIDPADPPREMLIQWNDGGGDDGGWAHRAYWGEDLIDFGIANSPSRRPMGPLPKSGEWVRLEIPAAAVGFTGAARISGMSFDQAGGAVWWDRSGVVHVPENPATTPLGDLLWTLFTSPEFQYIR